MKSIVFILLLFNLCACEVPNVPVKQEKILTFIDGGFENGPGYFYVFKTNENKSIKFIKNNDSEFSLLFKRDSDAYPNKKLLGKTFKVNFELIEDPATEQADSVYSLNKLTLIDSVENYNEFLAEDSTSAPNCTDESVLNLLEVRCYDSLFTANNEKLLSTYDYRMLAEDEEKLTCDCECKVESSNRKYFIAYKVHKNRDGEINITLSKK